MAETRIVAPVVEVGTKAPKEDWSNDITNLNKQQQQIHDQIWKEAEAQGVDPNLAITIGWIENRFKPTGKSSAGALGPMQVMPSNAKPLGIHLDDLKDPATNIHAGVKLLKQNLDRYDGNVRAAVVAYNGSPSRAAIYLRNNEDVDVLRPETKDYLKQVEDLYIAPAGAKEEKSPFDYDLNVPQEQGVTEENPFGKTAPIPKHILEAQNAPLPPADLADIVLEKVGEVGGDVMEHPEAGLAGAASGAVQKYFTMPSEVEPSPFERKQAARAAKAPAIPYDPEARVLQGGLEGDLSGRARQGYNDLTSLRAQEAAKQKALAEELARKGILDPNGVSRAVSTAGISGATPSGVLTNQNVLDTLHQEAIAPKQSAFSRVMESSKKVPSKVLSAASRYPIIGNTLSGVNAGLSAREFSERAEQGDIPGAAVAGFNTAAGALGALPAGPSPALDVAKGVGMAGELAGLPLELWYQKWRREHPMPSVIKKTQKKAEGGHATAFPLSLKHVYFHRLKKQR